MPAGEINYVEVENFTGTTKIAIEQESLDASIYLSNMIELAHKDIDEIIRVINEQEGLLSEFDDNIFNALVEF